MKSRARLRALRLPSCAALAAYAHMPRQSKRDADAEKIEARLKSLSR